MMTQSSMEGSKVTGTDLAAAVEALHTDGVVGRQGAFTADFVDGLRVDIDAAFD